MKKTCHYLGRALALAAMLTAVSFTATATQIITGSIAFSGGVTLDSTSLATATEVTSWHNDIVVNAVEMGSVLDSFINVGDSVIMADPWKFDSGISDLWSVGGFSFNLVTSSVVFQSGAFLSVEGSGFVSGNGYDPTPGSWYFSSQGRGNGNFFSFSASNDIEPVADSGSMLGLLGLAIGGILLVRKCQ